MILGLALDVVVDLHAESRHVLRQVGRKWHGKRDMSVVPDFLVRASFAVEKAGDLLGQGQILVFVVLPEEMAVVVDVIPDLGETCEEANTDFDIGSARWETVQILDLD